MSYASRPESSPVVDRSFAIYGDQAELHMFCTEEGYLHYRLWVTDFIGYSLIIYTIAASIPSSKSSALFYCVVLEYVHLYLCRFETKYSSPVSKQTSYTIAKSK